MGFLSDRYHFKSLLKRLAAGLFDAAGHALFFNKRRAPLQLNKMKRVLFIRLDQIGDIALMLPALRVFRERLPHVTVDVLTSPEGAAILREDVFPGKIHVFTHNWFKPHSFGKRWHEALCLAKRLRSESYDAAVDFRGDLRTILMMAHARIPERIGYSMTGGGFLLTRCGRYWPDLHQAALNMALLGFFGVESAVPAQTPLTLNPDEVRYFWENQGKSVPRGKMPLLVIHAGAGRPEKVWERLKYRRLVERMLKDELGHMVLVGTEADHSAFGDLQNEHKRLTDLRGKTGLREMLVLLSETDVFIGGDSGPAHLAAVQGARVVSIFKGADRPQLWHPWTNRLFLVCAPEPCPACGKKLCRKRKDCLETISARQVYAAVLEAWREASLKYPLRAPVQPVLEEF